MIVVTCLMHPGEPEGLLRNACMMISVGAHGAHIAVMPLNETWGIKNGSASVHPI